MLSKPNFMRMTTLGFVAILATGVPAYAQAPNQDEADHVKGCEFCHGALGNSAYDLIPRLNGQQFQYTMARLNDLGQATPDTPHGINMAHAANVDEASRTKIANYFAQQTPTAPKRASTDWSAGQKIYQNGIPAAKIAACQSCHGPEGEGNGAVPRLAGQHASYLRIRIWALSQFDLPGNRGMHRSAAYLTRGQTDAVISYLANE